MSTDPDSGTTTNAAAVSQYGRLFMDNYGAPPIELVSGRGAEVVDVEGNQYLDLLGGIAVNALGHAHPAVIRAVSDQIATLGHVSNYFTHPRVLELAGRLLEISGAAADPEGGRVLFCNSGTEANEAAFKIARLTGRPRIISTHGGFHGRTMGSLALTGQPTKQAPFGPMVPGVEFVDYGDPAALEAVLDDSVAAVFLEPIQGENGVVVPPDGYLAVVREATRCTGTLLVLDEIQTGIGRTGAWFAHQRDGITPDVLTMAKGLGGGLPIGAVVAFGAAGALLTPGLHGSTFAGNPVCSAAALAVLRTIEQDHLLDHVQQIGKHLAEAIEQLGHPLVSHVRGAGLLLGVVLTGPVGPAVVTAARDAGFLINAPAGDVLRLAPPLILSRDQADAFVAALGGILDTAATALDAVPS